MSIVVQVEVSSVDREYPWIGVSDDGPVVLFTGEKVGVVLADTDTGEYADDGVAYFTPGYHFDGWVEDEFREFKGTVTLGN